MRTAQPLQELPQTNIGGIQLGACRERCLELEMQVNVKNDQIDRLERKLAKARKAHEVDVQRYRGKVSSPFNACVFVVDFG